VCAVVWTVRGAGVVVRAWNICWWSGLALAFGSLGLGSGQACKLPRSRVDTYRKDAAALLDPPACEL
jgi:hypothetical protein